MNHKKQPNIISQKGQSLVEVALFFPIFLVLLAGMVEVSNILVTANKVTSAARASTRFAINGGEDAGMATVALNTVTQTLEVSDDVWDIWAIRGTVNSAGNAFDSWEFTHVYGISNTQKYDDVDEEAIKDEALAQLQRDENGNSSNAIAADLRIAGTYAIHDINSILGLNAMPQYADITSVADLSVMRVSGIESVNTDGCDGFPIAVHEGIRSVTPTGQGANPYPYAADFAGPSNPRTYESFINHQDNIPLLQATEGTVYKIENGFGAGNFGWINWNTGIAANANTLQNSLAWPGNANDYTNQGDGGQILPGQNSVVRGYIEPGDSSDTDMQIGDWVSANTGAVNSSGVRNTLEEHIDLGRTLRVIVWNNSQQQGVNGQYQISGFAIFRLQGYRLQGNDSWILAEFIRWDNSCGQPTNFAAP